MSFIPDPRAARREGAGRSAEEHAGRDDGDRWRTGAAGEQTTGALLQPLALTGWTVLHDRAVSGSAANIDHLVSDGASLWVVDTKVWRGKIVRLGDNQLWYADAPAAERLRSLDFMVEAAERIVCRHQDVSDLVVRALVCIHGATLPESPTVENGTALVSPVDLVPLLVQRSTGHPTPELRAELDRLFPPRSRHMIDTHASIPLPRRRNKAAPSQQQLPLQWP